MDNNDIVTQIALHLDVKNIKKLCCINKNYNNLLNDDYFWYLLVEHQYPGIPYMQYKDIYSYINTTGRLIVHFLDKENTPIKEWLLLHHKNQYLEYFTNYMKIALMGCSTDTFIKTFNLFLNNKIITTTYRHSYVKAYYITIHKTMETHEKFKTEQLTNIMDNVKKEFNLPN